MNLKQTSALPESFAGKGKNIQISKDLILHIF